MIGNAGGIIGQMGLGIMSKSISIATGYLTGSALFCMALPFILKIRKLDEDADRT
ncbi:unnamed protein product [marine sediment metagenome]|uniref:Uncharacterized protein n=1 Tax=marine sediment metagenome TaxID=412755 RepID=X1EDT9_9ZZZZ